MSSVSSIAARVLALLALAAATTHAAPADTSATATGPLRVCADPNNLPFSNARQQGFENAIARLVAADLHYSGVAYTWWPQRRGFVRNTLKSGDCDVVMGVPAQMQMLQTTRPYYRSSYVFLTRSDHHLDIRSFDDPRLRTLRIGLHAVGDDYANVPPATALARRGIVDNLHGYSIYGDYSQPDPPRALVDAVARGDVDVAIVWGPFAGFFAKDEPVALTLHPVEGETDPALAMQFPIAMGVRKDDTRLRAALDDFIVHRQAAIDGVLARFGIPVIDTAVAAHTDNDRRP